MTRNLSPIVPAKPAEITLDTLPQLFAHHAARFGGWSMNGGTPGAPAAPQRPDGISEEEWTALGDPGRVAIVREREARQAAERDLAIARAKPAPPKAPAAPAAPATGAQAPAAATPDPAAPAAGQALDANAIQKMIVEAVKPIIDRDAERDAQAAAGKITDAVMAAAKDKFHDPTDALSGIDLTKVVTDAGTADAAKITAELDALLTRKPHLGKPVDPRRAAVPGAGAGAGGAAAPLGDRVKDTLARMQEANGIKPPASS